MGFKMKLSRVIGIAVPTAAFATGALAILAQVYGANLADSVWRSLPVVVCVCTGVILPQYALSKLSFGGAKQIRFQRHFQHAATGLAIAGLYAWVLSRIVSVLCMGSATLAFALVQCARSRSKEVDAQVLAAFGALMKENERRGDPPASLFFLAGNFLAALCFSYRLCLFAMLSVSLG